MVTLIIISILGGIVGMYIGGLTNMDILTIGFGLVGVLSPSMYLLEKIYKEIKNK